MLKPEDIYDAIADQIEGSCFWMTPREEIKFSRITVDGDLNLEMLAEFLNTVLAKRKPPEPLSKRSPH